MTIAGLTTTQWFWILAAHASELGLIWWLLRPRIAKELAGEDAFAIRYQTVDKLRDRGCTMTTTTHTIPMEDR